MNFLARILSSAADTESGPPFPAFFHANGIVLIR